MVGGAGKVRAARPRGDVQRIGARGERGNQLDGGHAPSVHHVCVHLWPGDSPSTCLWDLSFLLSEPGRSHAVVDVWKSIDFITASQSCPGGTAKQQPRGERSECGTDSGRHRTVMSSVPDAAWRAAAPHRAGGVARHPGTACGQSGCPSERGGSAHLPTRSQPTQPPHTKPSTMEGVSWVDLERTGSSCSPGFDRIHEAYLHWSSRCCARAAGMRTARGDARRRARDAAMHERR